MKKILISSHDPLLVKNLSGLITGMGYIVDVVDQSSFAIKKAIYGDVDLIVIDSRTFGLSARETLEIIRYLSPDLPCVVLDPDNRHEFNELINIINLEKKGSFLRVKEIIF